MIIENINIQPLLKAFKKFEAFRLNINTEQEQAGAIQAFEFCFELAWKIMKKFLELRGLTANSPKEAFRIAALEQLIPDPEIWFEFLKKRNLSVHTYQEEAVTTILKVLPMFSQEIKIFLKNIGIPDNEY
jgi:nucleotidyltransferase substrate binding protein (TIGR01987 family)